MNIILEPLKQLLELMYNITGDWGLAIILLTLGIRGLILPLTMKQKISMKKQGEVSKKIGELRNKYANDKKRLDQEMLKYQGDMKESMKGCMGMLIQMPIFMVMFSAVKSVPTDIGSILVPWVKFLASPDKMFIIPIIYVIVLSLPNVLCNIEYFKVLLKREFSKSQVMMNIVFAFMIIFKAPVALGIYFITGGIISFIEDIIAGIVYRRKLSKDNVV